MGPQQPTRPQSRAVVVLSLALAGLLALWIVGGYVLVRYAPADFGELPKASASPSNS